MSGGDKEGVEKGPSCHTLADILSVGEYLKICQIIITHKTSNLDPGTEVESV